MPALSIESQSSDGSWKQVGIVKPTDPPGSVSHHDRRGRQIILFGCFGDRSMVWCAGIGIDNEAGSSGRLLTQFAPDLALATLAKDGDSFTMTLVGDKGTWTARFTHHVHMGVQ